MTRRLPRSGCKTFRVLRFIGSRPQGSRYSDIVRFVCEMNGKNYDLMEPGFRSDGKPGKVPMVRRHRGEWSTNLCYGRDAILRNLCIKGANKKWYLLPEVAVAMAEVLCGLAEEAGISEEVIFFDGGAVNIFENDVTIHRPVPARMSALAHDFPSDEIVNNSKVVHRTILQEGNGDRRVAQPPKQPETELELAIRTRKELREKLVHANQLHDEAVQAVERAKALALKTAGEAVVISREIDNVGARILKLLDEVK